MRKKLLHLVIISDVTGDVRSWMRILLVTRGRGLQLNASLSGEIPDSAALLE